MTQALFTLLGVLIATVAGFVGAWIQSRREHARWLRERRLDAFVAARAALDRVNLLKGMVTAVEAAAKADPPAGINPDSHDEWRQWMTGQVAADRTRYREASEAYAGALTSLTILGPDTVSSALRAADAAREVGTHEEYVVARKRLDLAMRSALNIRDA